MIDWKKWLVYLCIGLAVALMIASCATSKDNKAFNRVTANTTLLNKAGRIWEKSNPCIPADPVYIKGKTITTIDSSFAQDNINELNRKIDSLLQLNCPSPNIDSLKKAISSEVSKNCKSKIIYHNTVDTVREPDIRKLNLSLQDNANLQAENNHIKSDNSDLKSRLNKRTWEFWGLIVLIAGAIGLKFYLK